MGAESFAELPEFLAVLQMAEQPRRFGSGPGEFRQDPGQGFHAQSLAGEGFVDRAADHDRGVDAEGGLEAVVPSTCTAGGSHGLHITDSRGGARGWSRGGFDGRERHRDLRRGQGGGRADPAHERGEEIPETFRVDADAEPAAQPAPFQRLYSPEVVETMVDVLGGAGIGEADDDLHVVVEDAVVWTAQQVGRDQGVGWEALPEDRLGKTRWTAPVDGAERLAEVFVRGNVSRHEARGQGR